MHQQDEYLKEHGSAVKTMCNNLDSVPTSYYSM